MPKVKTNKAAKKRFRITRKGKVLAAFSFRRHLLADRSAKKKRHLRGTRDLDRVDKKRIKEMLPYG